MECLGALATSLKENNTLQDVTVNARRLQDYDDDEDECNLVASAMEKNGHIIVELGNDEQQLPVAVQMQNDLNLCGQAFVLGRPNDTLAWLDFLLRYQRRVTYHDLDDRAPVLGLSGIYHMLCKNPDLCKLS